MSHLPVPPAKPMRVNSKSLMQELESCSGSRISETEYARLERVFYFKETMEVAQLVLKHDDDDLICKYLEVMSGPGSTPEKLEEMRRILDDWPAGA